MSLFRRSVTHEQSIAVEMLALIERALGARRELSKVNVVIGPLSGVSPESLSFCFTPIAREMGFGSPDLVVLRSAAEAKCNSCGTTEEILEPGAPCSSCGSPDRTIVSGMECTVESVEEED